MTPRVRERLARARLLALDVDGTLTDGRVTWVGDAETLSFSVHDGQGLVWLREAGVNVVWISGRGSLAVESRAAELGIREVHLRAQDKGAVLADVQRRLGIERSQSVAMGDDLGDLDFAPHVAVLAAPANARQQTRERADLVTSASGGAGAVRELAEAILVAQDLWLARVARYGRVAP
jgi:3-deoxy-D-manno-octulosonate 8-phosphate phosphatase (KDO 8-P phosphatase)